MTTNAAPRTLGWDEIEPGDEIPPWEFEVTTTRIVAGALASRDFMPVHHDRDFANGQGSPDIFVNILTTNGLCVRFLTDWAGPEALVKELSIRLGAPAFPNDPLTFTGSVSGKSTADDEGFVEVEFKGTNSLGDHVIGTAVLSLLNGLEK
jgi:acyl dehydratase